MASLRILNYNDHNIYTTCVNIQKFYFMKHRVMSVINKYYFHDGVNPLFCVMINLWFTDDMSDQSLNVLKISLSRDFEALSSDVS